MRKIIKGEVNNMEKYVYRSTNGRYGLAIICPFEGQRFDGTQADTYRFFPNSGIKSRGEVEGIEYWEILPGKNTHVIVGNISIIKGKSNKVTSRDLQSHREIQIYLVEDGATFYAYGYRCRRKTAYKATSEGAIEPDVVNEILEEGEEITLD